jgi:hypothetical protein
VGGVFCVGSSVLSRMSVPFESGFYVGGVFHFESSVPSRKIVLFESSVLCRRSIPF